MSNYENRIMIAIANAIFTRHCNSLRSRQDTFNIYKYNATLRKDYVGRYYLDIQYLPHLLNAIKYEKERISELKESLRWCEEDIKHNRNLIRSINIGEQIVMFNKEDDEL